VSERDSSNCPDCYGEQCAKCAKEAAWVSWAEMQPSPKPSWLTAWEFMSEPDREVDRLIGGGIARAYLATIGATPAEPCQCAELRERVERDADCERELALMVTRVSDERDAARAECEGLREKLDDMTELAHKADNAFQQALAASNAASHRVTAAIARAEKAERERDRARDIARDQQKFINIMRMPAGALWTVLDVAYRKLDAMVRRGR
jgi:hypothetical protein